MFGRGVFARRVEAPNGKLRAFKPSSELQFQVIVQRIMLQNEQASGPFGVVGDQGPDASTRYVGVLLEHSVEANLTVQFRADPMLYHGLAAMGIEEQVQAWDAAASTSAQIVFLAIVVLVSIGDHQLVSFTESIGKL